MPAPAVADQQAFWDPTQVNYFPNPRFEAGAMLVTASRYLGTGVVDNTAVVSSPTIKGSYSLAVGGTNPNNLTNATLTAPAWRFPAAAGDVWSAGALAGFIDVNLTALLSLKFLDAGGAQLTYAATQTPPSPGPGTPAQRVVVENQVAPVGTGWAELALRAQTSGVAAAGRVLWDEVMLCRGPVALPFFDGDSGGAEWLGPRWWSLSQRHGESDEMAVMKSWVPPYFFSDPNFDGS